MLRIFTDTAANVPPHLLEQYHITAMPLTYLLDGQPTELVGHDYYEAMRKGAEVKTSLVSPALIRDTMESALKDGDDVLYIAISGGISGTCWSAELMAEELRGEYPRPHDPGTEYLRRFVGRGPRGAGGSQNAGEGLYGR